MRIVKLNELYSGMILGRSINYNERLLFPTYTVLTDVKIKELNSLVSYEELDDNFWILDLAELKPVILRESYIAHHYIDFVISLMRQVFSAILTSEMDFNRLSLRIRSGLINDRQLLYEILLLRNSHCYTFEHSLNVALYSLVIGLKMDLTTDELQDLLVGALLHDIGKMNISNNILNKSSSLTNSEFQAIKQHPNYGVDLTDGISCVSDRVIHIIQQHHEKLDGNGYPHKLSESKIDSLSKIVTVSDIFDAVISSRSYHEKRPVKTGIDIIRDDAENKKIDMDGVNMLISQLVVLPVNSVVLLSNEKSGVVIEDCKDMNPKVLIYESNEVCDLGVRKDIQVQRVIK